MNAAGDDRLISASNRCFGHHAITCKKGDDNQLLNVLMETCHTAHLSARVSNLKTDHDQSHL